MEKDRLKKQMEFILEIDKAKNIFRQTLLSDGKRRENDAEHSWHIAIMAFTIAEYFGDVDVAKVMKMTLMHDLVEIDAGDTYCYDEEGYKDKDEREQKAAERVYGLLPDDQAKEFKEIWREFEEGITQEAKFAVILDRIQPIMLTYASNGTAWTEHGVTTKQVLKRNEGAVNGPEEIANYLFEIIRGAEEKGYLIK